MIRHGGRPKEKKPWIPPGRLSCRRDTASNQCQVSALLDLQLNLIRHSSYIVRHLLFIGPYLQCSWLPKYSRCCCCCCSVRNRRWMSKILLSTKYFFVHQEHQTRHFSLFVYWTQILFGLNLIRRDDSSRNCRVDISTNLRSMKRKLTQCLKASVSCSESRKTAVLISKRPFPDKSGLY